MIDLLQSIAILLSAIGVIVNSIQVRKLASSRRCPTKHPTRSDPCRREAGHGGQHRAVYNQDLDLVWIDDPAAGGFLSTTANRSATVSKEQDRFEEDG